MKKNQVYTFKIDHRLDDDRRQAIAREIANAADAAEEPVSFAWDANDADQMHIDVGPVKLDVLFYADFAEVYVDAPLWARAMIGKEKEAFLKGMVASILTKARLIDAAA